MAPESPSLQPPGPVALPRLLDWIPQVTVRYTRPLHLLPLVELLERINAGEQVNAVVHAPPRHAKSDTVTHFIAWALKQHPRWLFGYVSYAEDLAKEKSRAARLLAKETGSVLTKDTEGEWRTAGGGGALATGIRGELTGRGLQVLIVDDPIGSRLEADSGRMRERTWEWHRDVGETRLEPGASQLVMGARWHPDDLSGRLIKEGWQYIRLPAIADVAEYGRQIGDPLWPDRYPLPALEKIRDKSELRWSSLYQGNPRPKGGKVFEREAMVAPELPVTYRAAIGIDLAYSKKKEADWSVAVVLLESGGKCYVEEVVRMQVASPVFRARLATLHDRWPTARIRFYGRGPEKGVVDLFASKDGGRPVPIQYIQTHEDKLARAQPVAGAWNRGDVLVPASAPWLDDFLDELGDFTGVDDVHDDQVDALAAAYDLLAGPQLVFY